MNYRKVFTSIGKLLMIEGLVMMISLLVAVIYHETTQIIAFAESIAIVMVAGFILSHINPGERRMRAVDAFMTVALSWIILSLCGALPFFLSGDIPDYIDAVFETVSGFTTTGASILTDVEALSHASLFWRSFIIWLGGMGILVFMLAILPLKNDNSLQLLRAESPGPEVDKIVPKMRNTALILYGIYFLLSVAEVVFLLIGGMSFFDAINHAMSTAGTGGFSTKNASVGYYNSNYISIVITIFMILFGVNFNYYYMILVHKERQIFKSSELRTYFGIIAFSIITVTISVRSMYSSLGQAAVDSAFSVGSIMSTTGFATADFDLWPAYAKTVLFVLMFIGACAGSTAGGFKISRIVILFKSLRYDLWLAVNPRLVKTIKVDGNNLSRKTISNVYMYAALTMIIMLVSMLIVSLDDFAPFSTLSAVVSCMNNVGPAFADFGPTRNYSMLSHLSKIVLSFDMLAGRLEIIPMLIIFLPRAWKKY